MPRRAIKFKLKRKHRRNTFARPDRVIVPAVKLCKLDTGRVVKTPRYRGEFDETSENEIENDDKLA